MVFEKLILQLLPIMLDKQAKLSSPPRGRRTVIQVSTKRKQQCPILSFVDHWLWAYARHHDRGDATALPEGLQARTHVRLMTPSEFQRPETV